MQSLFKSLQQHKWFWLGLILTAALLWPLFYAPYFSHHDDVQLIRIQQMSKCLLDFQIPCRWVPDLGAGYGYPLFNFYAPLAYYIGAVVFLITGSILFSAKFIFAFALLGSYIFMYLLGRKLWGELGGVISALLYSYVPYHALNLYVRGAMGEMWGMLFFPLILWALFRIKEKQTLFNGMLLSLGVGFLLTAHNLSALLFLPVSALCALIFLPMIGEKKKYLSLVGLGFLVGVLLSAFYWLPAYFEKDSTWVETTTVGYFSYTEHFKGVRKLFLETDWGYGNSIREVPGGELDGLSYQIGPVHVLVWFLMIGFIFYYRRKKDYKLQTTMVVLFSGVILLSIFMIHPRSQFIWDLLPQLKYVQFPWRFLLLISFSICLIGGGIGFLIEKFWSRKTLGLLLIIFIIVSYSFRFFVPKEFLYIPEQNWLQGDLWKIAQRKAILDYLPRTAKEAPAAVTDKDYEILTGNTQIKYFKKGSNWFSLEADVTTHTILRISVYDYAHWKVWVDGAPAQIDSNNNLGLITLLLGEGNHAIFGKLEDTPVRQLGNVLSIIGFVGVLLLGILGIRRTRKWLKYYMQGFK